MKKLLSLLFFIGGVSYAGTLTIYQGAPPNNVSRFNYTAVSTTYTVLSTDYFVNCSTSSNFTVTLPSAVGFVSNGTSQGFLIYNSSTGFINILPNGAELISGATFYKLRNRYEWLDITSDNVGWMAK